MLDVNRRLVSVLIKLCTCTELQTKIFLSSPSRRPESYLQYMGPEESLLLRHSYHYFTVPHDSLSSGAVIGCEPGFATTRASSS